MYVVRLFFVCQRGEDVLLVKADYAWSYNFYIVAPSWEEALKKAEGMAGEPCNFGDLLTLALVAGGRKLIVVGEP